MPAGAVLDFHQPEIRVELGFSAHALFDIERRHLGQDRSEQALALRVLDEGLRRRTIKAGAAVEAVELDEYRARLRRTATPQHRNNSLDRATPEMRGDPDIRAQTPHGAIT